MFNNIVTPYTGRSLSGALLLPLHNYRGDDRGGRKLHHHVRELILRVSQLVVPVDVDVVAFVLLLLVYCPVILDVVVVVSG